MHKDKNTPVIILDFGSQFTQLIAREIRSQGVYCEIEPYSIALAKLKAREPKALVLSGGPSSVQTGPQLMNAVLGLNIPILGICYGMQLISHLNKGKVAASAAREFGSIEIEILEPSALFKGFKKGDRLPVWMSHGDSVQKSPPGALVIARSANCPVVALQMGNLHCVQFHPEVHHTPIGKKIISNFLFEIVKLSADWKMENFLEKKTKEIQDLVGDNDVIGAVSGGVDSTLLAVFLNKVLGKRFHSFMIDNGLLRLNEAKQVSTFLKQVGVKLQVVDARALFLKRLSGVTDPERKRKIIGKAFIDVFEKECKRFKNAHFLAQGTLYPDVIESVSVKGPSHTIKTHHNVGGLPKRMKLKLIEPFRELFKDEVRALGRTLGVPETILERHPFPGPGLAVRILGKITPERLELLRRADAIFTEELYTQKIYSDIWQAFTVLLPVKAVGVMGRADLRIGGIASRGYQPRRNDR